jgi:hypothetical protein
MNISPGFVVPAAVTAAEQVVYFVPSTQKSLLKFPFVTLPVKVLLPLNMFVPASWMPDPGQVIGPLNCAVLDAPAY